MATTCRDRNVRKRTRYARRELNIRLCIQSTLYFTCVSAALREHELVERAETLGSRRKRRKAVREASMFRVAPFVTLDDTDETNFKLTGMYTTLLDKAGVKHFES